jgi:hypothetical protein
MKRAFLLIVVPALLVALGFAQTPAASSNTDQTIKGCLGGSDGNYTVVEDGTGHIFKITANSIDFKKHLGHDVTLIGHKAGGVSSAAADNSFAVTELNMISEHCAAAAAAPTATVTTPSETASTPPAAAATVTTPAETVVTPPATAVPPVEIVVTPPATLAPPAETVVTPAATAAAPAETVVTPAADPAPPAETVVTPPADASAPVATVSTPSETAGTPDARHRRRSETAAVATTAPDVTASSSSETASAPAAATTPAAAASTPSETASTQTTAATPPVAPARHGALGLLIAVAVLVIVIGTLVPFLSRWRKQKMLERTVTPNLSFNREASSDQDKPEQPRKAA